MADDPFRWLDDFTTEDPRTCQWCLGADGWWDEYLVPVEQDTTPPGSGFLGTASAEQQNVYKMWMPCPRCLAHEQLELPFTRSDRPSPHQTTR